MPPLAPVTTTTRGLLRSVIPSPLLSVRGTRRPARPGPASQRSALTRESHRLTGRAGQGIDRPGEFLASAQVTFFALIAFIISGQAVCISGCQVDQSW
jgi:hypothetical protein